LGRFLGAFGIGFVALGAFFAVVRGAVLAILAVLPVTAPSAATAAPAFAAPIAALFAVFARFGLAILVLVVLLGDIVVVHVLRDGFELRRRGRARAGAGDAHLRAFFLAFGQHFDGDPVAVLDFGEIGALGIEQVHRRLGRSIKRDNRALALGRLVLDQPQRRETRAG